MRQLILFIALISLSTWAKTDCPNIKRPFTAVHLNTMGMWGLESERKVTCRDAIQVANTIIATNNVIGSALYTNIQYDLYFTRTNDNAFASIHLHVPLQLMIDEYSKHPKFTQPVWIHEYAHLLFNFNVSRKWRKYNKYNWYLTSYSEYQLISYQLDRLDNMTQTPWVKQEIARLEKKLDYFEKKIEEFENDPHMPPVYEFSELTDSYNELFADIVAVGATMNPNAISDALRMTGLSKDYSQKYIHNRDFDDKRNKLDRFDVDIETPHNVLAAVRYHIWKYYFSNPRYNQYRGIVMSKLLHAIVYEMKLLDKANRSYDAKTLNKRLIDRIDITFE